MKFEKVSKEAWIKECYRLGIPEQESIPAYDNIKLPTRSTNGSCGYDFVCPINMQITADRVTLIPTGIRVFLDDGYFLMLVPRSSCIKKGYTMANNVGIIDQDFVGSTSEGNIMVPVISTGKIKYAVDFKVGYKIAQGIIVPFATIGDTVETTRIGGFGSTDELDKKDDNEIKENELNLDDSINVKDEVLIKKEVEEDLKTEIPIEEKIESEIEKEEVIENESNDSIQEAKSEEIKSDKESNIEQESTSIIQFNNHFSIYSNIINDFIINELSKMIEFSKIQDPLCYVSFISLKNKVKSVDDIESMYKTVNEWYSSIDNPDVLTDIYIRDATIVLISKMDVLGEDELKTLIDAINTIRTKGTNGEKLMAGKAIYVGLEIEDSEKLINHLNTTFNDIIVNYK